MYLFIVNTNYTQTSNLGMCISSYDKSTYQKVNAIEISTCSGRLSEALACFFFIKYTPPPEHVIEAKIFFKKSEGLSKNFPTFLRVLVMIKIMPVLCLP
jgi:hypothetical protein